MCDGHVRQFEDKTTNDHGHFFRRVVGLALRIPEKRHYNCNQLSEERVFVNSLQVNGCIAGGQRYAAVVRVSRHSASKAEMGTGRCPYLSFFGAMVDAT